MNKAELIKAVMDKCRPGDFASKAAAERAVNALTSVISDELKAGNDVSIYGFGTFSTVSRDARMGRNVRTGEPMAIPATVVPKFKASKNLKDEVAAAHGCAAE